MSGSEALLAGLIDYAGLFPPASLSMPEAVARHAAALRGPQAWMLGRFVVPARRLGEFRAAFDAAGIHAEQPWRLAALIGEEPDAAAGAIGAFNARHSMATGPGRCLARIDAWEGTVADPSGVERLAAAAVPGLLAAYEVPTAAGDWAPILAAVHRAGGIAKLRTGGVVASAIPTPRTIAAFVWQCVSMGVPFKATAGLHHPVRGEHRLTYDAGSPTAMMHGFLNVLAAAAVARQMAGSGSVADEVAVDRLERLLSDTDASAFRVSLSGVDWRDRHFAPDLLRQVRREVALSFGSCSFSEPVADLQALGVSLDAAAAPGNRS